MAAKKNGKVNSAPKNKTDNTPSHYVGIGASAGGLEAIEAFFKNMPPKNGLSFIVVQHLSPDYKSLMMEILSKRTEMKVFRAEDGMNVEANCVYLIPPKKNLTIFHGKLLLNDQDHSKGLNLPIDIFMRSLADDQGEKAIGVILSGTGSDGMRGVRSIKEQGGMVMVQDEESAKFDGMPRSAISTGLADFILPPEKMPAQLLAFVNHPYVSKSELSDTLLTNEDGLARIFSLLREKSKVDFTYYKPSTVVRRIERRMAFNQVKDLRDYVRFMETSPAEIMTLYRELLIGVTSFFRDPEAFDILQEKILPEILKNKENREIRFWISGCSTGEEAYSLAILCRECMEALERSIDVKIFATDIDVDAILHASNGVYQESVATDLSPKLLSKYFHRKDESFHVSRTIREMVVFAQHNLLKDPPFTNIDLVSCRNLLIYFQPVMQKKALEMFNFSLNQGGVLFLGSSESTGDMSEYFEMLDSKWKIYRSKGNKRPGAITATDRPHAFRARSEYTSFRNRDRDYVNAFESDRITERFLSVLAGDYIPLAIVANEQMELVHAVGETEGYFKVPTGKMVNEITKMAHPELAIPMATGIQKVIKKKEELTFSNIRIKIGDKVKNIKMRLKPLPEKKGQETLVAVFIEEATERTPKAASREFETLAYDIEKESQQRIQDLEQELQFTKENLQATIEELETSNEELQATNEELLASNEELQSTNEELQSVNEELHTVNAEYQRKIIELTELNNDIENLLAGAGIATIFIDENMRLRKYTPAAIDIYNLHENDLGRPFEHLKSRLMGMDPSRLMRRLQISSSGYEEEVLNQDGNWFLMRILPYSISPEDTSGYSITFIDITSLKKAGDALAKSEEELDIRTKVADIFLTTKANETYRQTLDYFLEIFHCEYGFLGYIDDNGDLVCPTLTMGVWEKCKMKGKSIVFPHSQWGGLWGDALKTRKPLYSNDTLKVPKGHVPISNSMASPILIGDELVGIIAVANTREFFTDKNLERLKTISNYMAPILKARIDRERETKFRLEAESESLKLKNELNLAFECVDDLITIIDKDFKVVKMNSALVKKLGGKTKDYIGSTCHAFMHCSDKPTKSCPHANLMKDGIPRRKKIYVEALKSDFLVTFAPLRDASGVITGCMHIAHDINACREAEKKS